MTKQEEFIYAAMKSMSAWCAGIYVILLAIMKGTGDERDAKKGNFNKTSQKAH